MACSTCGHTMQGLVTQDSYKIFWCPRCGSLKNVSGQCIPETGSDNEFVEETPTYWGRSVRDAARLDKYIDGIVPVTADFDVKVKEDSEDSSASIEIIKIEINYR